MSATTIKLEGDLLKKLRKVKPPAMSVSAYVRTLIEGDVKRRSLAAAAQQYQEFLSANPSEQGWLDEWMTADLVRPPREKGR